MEIPRTAFQSHALCGPETAGAPKEALAAQLAPSAPLVTAAAAPAAYAPPEPLPAQVRSVPAVKNDANDARMYSVPPGPGGGASPSRGPAPPGSLLADASYPADMRGLISPQLSLSEAVMHQLSQLQEQHQRELSDIQQLQYQQLLALKDQQFRQFQWAQQQLAQQDGSGVRLDASSARLQGRDTAGQNGPLSSAGQRSARKSPPQDGGLLVTVRTSYSVDGRSPPPPPPPRKPRFPAIDGKVIPREVPSGISQPILPRATEQEPRAASEKSVRELTWRNAKHIQLSALASAITSPYKSFRGHSPPPETDMAQDAAAPSPPLAPQPPEQAATSVAGAAAPTPKPRAVSRSPDDADNAAERQRRSQPPASAPGTASPAASAPGASPASSATPRALPRRAQSGQPLMRYRSYACHLCPKAFTLKTHLDAHLRRHAGERPHQCKQCGKRFIERGGLVKHERIHSGERPFKCTECSAAFAENSNLKRHLRTHTTHRPFRCSECPAAYAQRNDLLNHQHIHSGDQKQFGCEKCSASFDRKAHLNRHYNMIHRNAEREQKPSPVGNVQGVAAITPESVAPAPSSASPPLNAAANSTGTVSGP